MSRCCSHRLIEPGKPPLRRSPTFRVCLRFYEPGIVEDNPFTGYFWADRVGDHGPDVRTRTDNMRVEVALDVNDQVACRAECNSPNRHSTNRRIVCRFLEWVVRCRQDAAGSIAASRLSPPAPWRLRICPAEESHGCGFTGSPGDELLNGPSDEMGRAGRVWKSALREFECLAPLLFRCGTRWRPALCQFLSTPVLASLSWRGRTPAPNDAGTLPSVGSNCPRSLYGSEHVSV